PSPSAADKAANANSFFMSHSIIFGLMAVIVTGGITFANCSDGVKHCGTLPSNRRIKVFPLCRLMIGAFFEKKQLLAGRSSGEKHDWHDLILFWQKMRVFARGCHVIRGTVDVSIYGISANSAHAPTLRRWTTQ